VSADPIDRLEAGAQKAEDAWRSGDFASALQHYARAVGERLATSGYGTVAGVRLEAADFVVFERLSDLSRLFGRTEEADTLLDLTINQLNAAGNLYWADLLRVKRVDLALGRGCPRTAQSLLDEMRASIGDVTSISFTNAGLEVWERNCRWPDADERDRATIFALLYFVMGRLLASLGQYGQAGVALQRGLGHASQKRTNGRAYAGAQELAKQAVTPLQLALAAALLEKGELQGAAAQLDKLKGKTDEEKQPATFVQTLELRGKLNLLAGEFGAALVCFRQVLNLCARRGFGRAAVAATLNLAHALIFLNQTLDARRHLQRAREIAQGSGDLAMVARAEWLLQLASARAQSLADGVPLAPTVTEQWDINRTNRQTSSASEQSARNAAPASEWDAAFDGSVNPMDLPQSDNYLSFFEERALGFQWLLGRRDFGACAAYLAQLQKIFAHTDSILIKLRLRIMSGLLAYYEDDFEQAEKLLTAAQPELRRLRLLPELWQAQRMLGWCRQKLGRDETLQEESGTENARLLGAMARTLEQDDRAFFLLNKWTAEEEELAVRINRLSRMKKKLDAATWHQRLRLRWHLNAELDELLSIVDRYRDMTAQRMTRENAAPESAATGVSQQDFQATQPRSFWRRLWQSKRRHATISFLVLPDRVLVVRRSRFALDFGVSRVSRIEVRNLVREWHEIIAQILAGRTRGLGKRPDEEIAPVEASAALLAVLTDKAREVAERLSEILQLPSALDKLPRSTRSLTLVPDDSLHGFPFAAITHRGRYLIEHYALAFAYASDEQEPVRPVARTTMTSALLVGASRGGGRWPELPFVSEELDSIAAWATRRKLAVERLDDATPTYAAPDKATVLAALPHSTLAHVACHGEFKPDQPAQSGIVLSTSERPEMLSVQELSALDLSNLRHVTLSACWSADHFILPGRWVISLPETLARAGASSVLGCLWVVDDRIGTAFMDQFYQNLNKHSRAEALRRTQLACLKGHLQLAEASDTTQPIYWAGYQLYGRSDALKL
jgi:CHAT domain-containing protein/tetratricopeptide (TPR) repeat protein